MHLSDWLTYLESLNQHKIQLGLERVLAVAKRLQVNQWTCPVITVTGTNGKGSTVAFLESIYQAAHYKTGAYTSPHLFKFNERIRLNGHPIDDDRLTAAFHKVKKASLDISLTYFEFTTLAALEIFKAVDLDVLILEVGLGGRLDAVNIIEADVAVITAIGIDHSEWLGHDRASIAKEKAGIFRPNQWAVCGDEDPPETIQAEADRLQTQLHTVGQHFSYQHLGSQWCWQTKHSRLTALALPQLPLENAATSLMVIHLLQTRLPVRLSAIQEGLKQAYLPARFQKQGRCILDVAHNPHAATWLAKQLQQSPTTGRTLAVVGMLADKDIKETLKALRNSIDVWYVGGLEDHPRGASAEKLCHHLAQLQIEQWYNCGSVTEACKMASGACQSADRVLVFGSFYTVSLCYSVLEK